VQAALKTFATNLANGIRIAAEWISGTLIPAVRDLYNWLAPILGPILVEVGRALSEDLPRGIERFVSWLEHHETGVKRLQDRLHRSDRARLERDYQRGRNRVQLVSKDRQHARQHSDSIMAARA
jgi:hypothetical protein